MRIEFVVDGRPKGKGRPRSPKGGGRPFTPAATVAAEKAIAEAYRGAAGAAQLMTGTVRLDLEAVFKVPKSWPKKLREAAFAGQVEYTGKPDRDNIEKLYMDALNSVAWVDDAQVNRGPIVRRYGWFDRVEVVVEELEAVAGLKSPAERRREAKVARGEVGTTPRPRKRRASAPSATELLPSIGKRLR